MFSCLTIYSQSNSCPEKFLMLKTFYTRLSKLSPTGS
jgi:hypothetical protein